MVICQHPVANGPFEDGLKPNEPLNRLRKPIDLATIPVCQCGALDAVRGYGNANHDHSASRLTLIVSELLTLEYCLAADSPRKVCMRRKPGTIPPTVEPGEW